MDALVTALNGAEHLVERGDLFPNPFDREGPTPIAQAAANLLQSDLRNSGTGTDFESGGGTGHGANAENKVGRDDYADTDNDDDTDAGNGNGTDNGEDKSKNGNTEAETATGKMYGVLVVESPEGELGFLRAFSGMFQGGWDLPGFVPPVFDRQEREQLETEGEASVKRLTRQTQQAQDSPELKELRERLSEVESRHAAQTQALRDQHRENRAQRRSERKNLDPAGAGGQHGPLAHGPSETTLAELAQQSRQDKAEKRALIAAQHEEAQPIIAGIKRLERRIEALNRLRRFVSRRLMQQIHDTYRLPNGAGEHKNMRALFAPGEPPSGAGDCAGPKLLAYAYRHGLKPVALAEFWWGAPPPTGGRLSGVYYPACRGKCGPLLRHMLGGLATVELRSFVPADSSHLDITIVHEDQDLIVIDKPSGLLSVPSSNRAITDSAELRLQRRYPNGVAPKLVHRIDLDTSGLLIAARNPAANAKLQKQFIRRAIQKRYIAWIDGLIDGEEGTIDLAIRVDLDDRPRHVHDPDNGRPAVTKWRVIERKEGRTRIEFQPATGRTHQLRVHAAHPLGLGAPIVGDYLYGRGGQRLLLHAEWLRFRHPSTNEFVSFESPAPF